MRFCCLLVFLAILTTGNSLSFFPTSQYGYNVLSSNAMNGGDYIPLNKRSSEQEDEFPYQNIRLPKDIVPKAYKVHIKTELPDNFDFSGRVEIDIKCVKATKYVILHYKNLEIKTYELLNSRGQEVKVVRMLKNVKNEQILIEAQNNLQAGSTYKAKISFEGQIPGSFAGFYKSSYKTASGETRHLGATQFEPTDARAAFPCFDEPEFKAFFQINIEHKKENNAISNMPVKSRTESNSLTVTRFERSIKMSTYLVAFVVSDFESRSARTTAGTEIRAWTSKDNLPNTQLVLEIAKKQLTFYEEYFNIPFPLPKLDLVGVPEFAAGAMENWGLVTYNEAYFLSNEASATANSKYLVALVTGHELAHQWFGNLVTMRWWNDLWLNEAFANYMMYYGMDNYAKSWKVFNLFVRDTHQSALDADSLASTHPISVKVTNPNQINEIFDVISYNKGSSVLRMLDDFLGADIFRKGLEKYLKERKYDNAEADDLWNSFTSVTKDIDVKTVMDTWIKQKGYPVVEIKNDGNSNTKMKATQTKFLIGSNPSEEEEAQGSESTWYIPLTWVTSKSPSNPTRIWMNKNSVTFDVPSGAKWIKANYLQTGFYRVNYDEQNWRNLIQQLKDDHTVLEPKERSGLIDDALNLARSNLLDMDIALEITSYLGSERNFIPFATSIKNLNYIGNMLGLRLTYIKFQKYMRQLMKPLLSYVGWENDHDLMKSNLRDAVLLNLGNHGEKEVVDESLRRFRAWKDDSQEVPGNIRTPVYVTAVMHGGEEEWEFLWGKYQNSIDPTERQRIEGALSGALNINLKKRLLNYSLDDNKIKGQDVINVIVQVAKHVHARTLVWKFFKDHFNTIIERIGGEANQHGIASILKAVAGNFNQESQLQEYEALVEQHQDVLGEMRAVKQVKESIRINIAWMSDNEQKVSDFLVRKTDK